MKTKDELDTKAARLFALIRTMKSEPRIVTAIAKELRRESNAAFERGRVVGFGEGMR
jgi:hypothetical protein